MEEILLSGRDSKYNTGTLSTKSLSNNVFDIPNSMTQMTITKNMTA